MSVAKVNNINTGLMLLSLGLAFVLPFELFLFSYAVLGPAHYLTEISWLHDRQYFSPRKFDYLWLVACSLVVFFGSSYVLGKEYYIPALTPYSTDMVIAAFGLALIFVVFKNWTVRAIALGVLALGIITFRTENWVPLIFAIYLPTLIHVYVFTGAFILFGAIKGHSRSGYLSFLVFLGCGLVALFANSPWIVTAGDYVKDSYQPFSILSIRMIDDLGLGVMDSFLDIFESEAGQAAMRFIAFAYTYHYLNWFSKTSIIKWHEIPKSRFILVCLLWVVSVGIYIYDYGLGLRWLFFLSFAHVLLEFPLNHQSFIGIGKGVKENLSSRRALAA